MNQPNYWLAITLVAIVLAQSPTLRAAKLQASDGATGDDFGTSVSQSGSSALVGAREDEIAGGPNAGSAYLFRNVTTATGTVTQTSKLNTSDSRTDLYFGTSVSISGDSAIIGSFDFDTAYLFRNLNSASTSKTQDVRLTPDDSPGAQFGANVAIDGNIGLVGAFGANSGFGSVYVYRDLNLASGTVTQSLKLVASNPSSDAFFGSSLALQANLALIGSSRGGKAYVFRNVASDSGTINESIQLQAYPGSAQDGFGSPVALSGTTGLIGARGFPAGASPEETTGAAYVFRTLDTGNSRSQHAKLLASDGQPDDHFGAGSLSGTTALVTGGGKAYVFFDLNTASGTITQDLRFYPSQGAAGFTGQPSLSGDQFVVASSDGDGNSSGSGVAYSGSIAAMSTLDSGTTNRTIDGLSFVSQNDWIIGENTDGNFVTLSVGGEGRLAALKYLYIGKTAGSDNNRLILQGFANTARVTIGSPDGNTGNAIQLDASAGFNATFRLAPGNLMLISGNRIPFSALEAYLGTGRLQVWENNAWTTVTTGNAASLITLQSQSSTTIVRTVAQPTPSPTPGTNPNSPDPTLTVDSDKKVRTTRRRVVLRGSSSDATLVEFKAGRGGFSSAKGRTAKWRIPVRLLKKRTVIKIRATGPGGRTRIQKIIVIRR